MSDRHAEYYAARDAHASEMFDWRELALGAVYAALLIGVGVIGVHWWGLS